MLITNLIKQTKTTSFTSLNSNILNQKSKNFLKFQMKFVSANPASRENLDLREFKKIDDAAELRYENMLKKLELSKKIEEKYQINSKKLQSKNPLNTINAKKIYFVPLIKSDEKIISENFPVGIQNDIKRGGRLVLFEEVNKFNLDENNKNKISFDFQPLDILDFEKIKKDYSIFLEDKELFIFLLQVGKKIFEFLKKFESLKKNFIEENNLKFRILDNYSDIVSNYNLDNIPLSNKITIELKKYENPEWVKNLMAKNKISEKNLQEKFLDIYLKYIDYINSQAKNLNNFDIEFVDNIKTKESNNQKTLKNLQEKEKFVSNFLSSLKFDDKIMRKNNPIPNPNDNNSIIYLLKNKEIELKNYENLEEYLRKNYKEINEKYAKKLGKDFVLNENIELLNGNMSIPISGELEKDKSDDLYNLIMKYLRFKYDYLFSFSEGQRILELQNYLKDIKLDIKLLKADANSTLMKKENLHLSIIPLNSQRYNYELKDLEKIANEIKTQKGLNFEIKEIDNTDIDNKEKEKHLKIQLSYYQNNIYKNNYEEIDKNLRDKIKIFSEYQFDKGNSLIATKSNFINKDINDNNNKFNINNTQIIESSIFKGVFQNRDLNNNPDGYYLIDNYEDLGIKYFYNKALSGNANYILDDPYLYSMKSKGFNEDYINPEKLKLIKKRDDKILLRMYFQITDSTELINLNNNNDNKNSEKNENKIFRHLLIFENELDSRSNLNLLNKNFSEWISGHELNMSNWKLVDVDNFMKGNPLFLNRSDLENEYIAYFNNGNSLIHNLESYFNDIEPLSSEKEENKINKENNIGDVNDSTNINASSENNKNNKKEKAEKTKKAKGDNKENKDDKENKENKENKEIKESKSNKANKENKSNKENKEDKEFTNLLHNYEIDYFYNEKNPEFIEKFNQENAKFHEKLNLEYLKIDPEKFFNNSNENDNTNKANKNKANKNEINKENENENLTQYENQEIQENKEFNFNIEITDSTSSSGSSSSDSENDSRDEENYSFNMEPEFLSFLRNVNYKFFFYLTFNV
jgi:hypothetical protein